MNDGLWRDDLRCGCRKGGGHSCRPPWMTVEEWAGVALDNITFNGSEARTSAAGINSDGVRLEIETAPGVSDTTEGLAATPRLESALASSQSSEPTPTSVYRYYDANSVLVYVGITSRGIQRNREHNTDKAWWSHVARQEVEHYPNRVAASNRERQLVRQFRPPFNTHYNPDHKAVRDAYLAFLATQASDESPRDMVTRLKNQIPLYPVSRSDEHSWFRTDIGHWPIAGMLLRTDASRVSVPGSKPGGVAAVESSFPFAHIRVSKKLGGTVLRAEMSVRWSQNVKPQGFEIRTIQLWTEPTERELKIKARKTMLYNARHHPEQAAG